MIITASAMKNYRECDAECERSCPYCNSDGSVTCWQCGGKNTVVDDTKCQYDCLDCGSWEEVHADSIHDGYRLGNCEVRLVSSLYDTSCSHSCPTCGGCWSVCQF